MIEYVQIHYDNAFGTITTSWVSSFSDDNWAISGTVQNSRLPRQLGQRLNFTSYSAEDWAISATV